MLGDLGIPPKRHGDKAVCGFNHLMDLYHAADRREWRKWLAENCETKREVWLLFYKKGSEQRGVDFEDALDEAACFGWVDSLIKKVDDQRYARKFTPRSAGSAWSRSNFERVERLRREGRMTARGLAVFEQRTARTSAGVKRPNSEETPSDLLWALRKDEKAWTNYQKFAPSHKRAYLLWITSAKKPETRRRRVEEAVRLISLNRKSLMK